MKRETPALFTVITNSYQSSDAPAQLELVAVLLIAHVKHHLELGLVGTVHYEVEPYLSYLAAHPGIQILIQQGTLRLIRWDLEPQVLTAFGSLLNNQGHGDLIRSI